MMTSMLVEGPLRQLAPAILEFVSAPERCGVRGVVAVEVGGVALRRGVANFRWIEEREFGGLLRVLGEGAESPGFRVFLGWVRSFDPAVMTVVVTLDSVLGTRAYLCENAGLGVGEWVGESVVVFEGDGLRLGDFRSVDVGFVERGMGVLRGVAAEGFRVLGRGAVVLDWSGRRVEPEVSFVGLEDALVLAEGVREKAEGLLGAYDPVSEMVVVSVRDAGCSVYRVGVRAVSQGVLDAASVPREFLRGAIGRFPSLVKAVEAARLGAGDWDRRVFMPSDRMFLLLAGEELADELKFPLTNVLAAAVAWRMTKGVYLVEPEVLDVLWRTRFSGVVPESVVNLPEWCPYVSVKRVLPRYGLMDGFWVRADQSTLGALTGVEPRWVPGGDPRRLFLSIVIMPGEGNVRDPWTIPLPVGLSIREAIEDQGDFRGWRGTVAERDEASARLAEVLEPIVAVTLYLNGREDIVNRRGGGVLPGNPVARKTKGGWREFASDRIEYWEVAFRVARRLRAAAAVAAEFEGGVGVDGAADDLGGDGGRKSPRPHLRRGYFGVRWRGPRSSPEPVIRWVNPTMVNAASPDELPATVIQVKD